MCVRLIYLVPQVTYQHSAFISEPLSAQNTRLGRGAGDGHPECLQEVSIPKVLGWTKVGPFEHVCTFLQGGRHIPGERVSDRLWACSCWGLSRCLFLISTCCALQILGYFDYAFTAIFTVEILLKVMAFSLILAYSEAAVAITVAILCLPSRC